MSSDEDQTPCSSVVVKRKYQRRAPLISIAATQNCIAEAMAKVIGNMVNPELKMQCVHMLEVNDFEEVQEKILELLQEIDYGILEEQERKERQNKRRKSKRIANKMTKRQMQDK